MYTLLKKSLQTLLLAGSVALGGCDDNLIPAGFDGGILPPVDAGLTYCVDSMTGQEDLVDLSSSNYNCGACNNECDPIADCRDGDCTFPDYYDENRFCEDNSWCPPEEICIILTGNTTGYCGLEELICEFGDVCETGKLCITGYCTDVVPEICNGEDDDADGFIDDGVPPRVCYVGPIDTRNIGLCTDGQSLCIDGAYQECIGSITPIEENGILRCDGLDNDCDGCPDNQYDGFGECRDVDPIPFDIVIMIDVSGSMDGEIAAARDAAEEFAARFAGNLYYRFAVFKFPLESGETWEDTLLQSFSNFSDLQSALDEAQLFNMTSVYPWEPSLDMPYLIATDHFERYGLRFRDGSQRIYILFTDEPAQSVPYAGTPYVDSDLLCSAFRQDDIFAVVADPRTFGEWGSCALYFPIAADSEITVREFDTILDSACDPGIEFRPIQHVPRETPLPIPRRY